MFEDATTPNSQLKSKAKDSKQLSLAFAGHTDISNTAQFLFTGEVSAELEVTQELALRKSLSRASILRDVFKELEKTPIQCRMKWNLLRCVTPEGGENVWSRKRYTGQIHKASQNVRCLKSMFILDVTRQKVFGGIHLTLSGY